MSMNDFIRGATPVQQPAGLSEHEETRVVFYMETCQMPYKEALDLVRGYQAPPAVNASAGAGTARPPAAKPNMNNWIRRAAGYER